MKHLVAEMFRLDILQPDKINDNEPLIGGRLGLDSLDTLELAICIEEEFGISVCSGIASRGAFHNIASLANFIYAETQTISVGPCSPAIPRMNLMPCVG